MTTKFVPASIQTFTTGGGTDGYILVWNSSAAVWSPQIQDAYRMQNRKISADAPLDGYALVWNVAANQWIPALVGTGTASMPGTAAVTFGVVNDGCSASVTISVPGAVIGNTVSLGLNIAVPDGCLISGNVNTTDEVRASFFNFSGAPVTMTAATIRADVWPVE